MANPRKSAIQTIAQGFGTDSLKGDVNGVVNVFDLVFVAGEIQ